MESRPITKISDNTITNEKKNNSGDIKIETTSEASGTTFEYMYVFATS